MANRLFSLFAPFLWDLEQNKNVRLTGLVVNGTDVPIDTSGSGWEISGGVSNAQMVAYNRIAGAYIPAIIDGDTVRLRHLFTTRLTVDAQGATAAGSFKPASYTVATLPSASTHGAGAIIYVSNETGGAVPAFSDGSVWRRCTDRAVVA